MTPLVAINDTLDIAILSKDSSNIPTDSDALPTYRIYGSAGLIKTGSLTYKDTGTVTGATQASPTVYTSVGHGLTVGTKVTIAGASPAGFNTTGDVTAVTSNTFSVAVDNSGAAWVSGGTWHATGAYNLNVAPTVAANFASGKSYGCYVYAKYSGTTKVVGQDLQFQVT